MMASALFRLSVRLLHLNNSFLYRQDVLSASLKELEAAQEDLAALNMPAASAPPPKPVITISSQPEDEEASQLQRKRSQVISRTRSNQPPATSSDPSPDVPPSAMLAGGQHGKKAEALSLFHAVAQLEAGSLQRKPHRGHCSSF